MKHTNINIAVIVSGIDEEYQNMILRGIHTYAALHNVNICHYIAFGGMLSNPKHDVGEFNIYNLVNYDYIDGVILLTNTVASSKIKELVTTEARRAGIPTVSVDNDLPDFYHIGINNYKAMYDVVEHVITKHNVTRINYVTGPDNNPESQLRLQAFYDVMKEHNLPIEEARIYHGMFTAKDGRAAAEQFMTDDRPFPEAIICANDAMAISVLLTLEASGINAPDDVIITGFDNIYTARNYSPELSSVSRPLFETGQHAVEMILNDINHITQERSLLLDSTPVFTESCGCHNAMGDSVASFKKDNYRMLELYNIDVQRNNRMACCLTECDSFEESLEQLKHYVREIACDAFYLCLCDRWRGEFRQSADSNTGFVFDDYTIDGYTEDMTVVLAYRDGEFFQQEDFPSKLMIPDLHDPSRSGKVYYFAPIHFRERCLGYCVICNSEFPMISPNFSSWIMNISNSLENIRKMNCMDAVVKELDKLYVIDPLSGIYNRNGFTRSTKEIYQYCTERQLPVMIMFLDMDGLKFINDTFGHKAGDKAITAIGQAIKRACAHGEIYSRFGGDEFLIFAVDYNEDRAKLLTLEIEAEFRRFNDEAGAGFEIGASIGYHIAVPDVNTPIFHLITVADQKMYDEKKKKKTSRYLRK